MNTSWIATLFVLSLNMVSAESPRESTSSPLPRTSVSPSAGDYRTVASGDWNATQTWERFNGSAWELPPAPPDSGSGLITIRSGDTVTIAAATTYDQLTVEAGGVVVVASGVSHTLTDGPGIDLIVDGTWLNKGAAWSMTSGAKWAVNDGGNFIQNSPAAFSSALSKCILSAGSNFVYRGGSAFVPSSSFAGRTYGNLTLESNMGQWSCTASGSSSLTVNGNLSIATGVRWNTGGFSGAIVVQGKTLIEGEWSGSGSGSQAVHTFLGEFRIASGGKYQLGTSGLNQGNIILRGDFINNGVFAGPANRLVLFDGVDSQTIGGSAITLFTAGLIAHQHIIVAEGMTMQIGAGKSMIASSNVDLLGSLSGSDTRATFVLAGSENRLDLHDASVSVAAVIAKDGQRHRISGIGRFTGSVITADSGSTIVLDAHLTLIESGLDPIGGTIVPTSGSTIVYKGFTPRPISPLCYGNLSVECSTGGFLVGPTSVGGRLAVNEGMITTGSNRLMLGPEAVLQENASAAVMGTVTCTRLPGRGVTESFGNVGLELSTSVELQDSITVCRVTGSAPIVSGGTAINKYFDLSSHGQKLTASLVLHYAFQDLIGKSPSGIRLLCSQNGGMSWSEVQAVANPSEKSFSYTGIVSDSRWTAAEMYPPPSLAKINPSYGSQGNRLTILVDGTGFEHGINELVFSGTGITVTSLNVISPVRCSVEIMIDSGATRCLRDILVIGPSGSAILKNVFEVMGAPNPFPSVACIVPSFGTRGKNTTVTLHGDGFRDKTTNVTFGDSISVRSIRTMSGCLVADITIAVGANPGLRDVTVSNPGPGGGSASLRSAFLVANPVPVVGGAFPKEGSCGQAEIVVLEGSDFVPGVSTVSFGEGIELDSIRVLSGTMLQVKAVISAEALPGFRDISVVNGGPGGGTAFLLGGFRVTLPVPRIFTLTPSIGVRGTSMKISIAGSNFLQGVSSLTLGGEVTVDSLVVVSCGQMEGRLRIPCNARSGSRSVTILNSGPGGGSSSLPDAFEIRNPVPRVVSVMPSSCVLGQTAELVLSGSGFIDGVSSVDFGEGIRVLSVFSDSVGEHLRASVAATSSALAGKRTVVVTNAGPGGGRVEVPDGLTIENPRPRIVEANPAGCGKGMSASVKIRGRNFLPGLTKVSLLPGIIVDKIMVENDSNMTVQIVVDSIAITGARGVVVSNPPPGGGSAELPHVFNVENLPPFITRVSPESALRGERVHVTIFGMNFAAEVTRVSFGSTMKVDSLTVVSANQLRLLLLVPEDAPFGACAIGVFNPLPGGGTAGLENGFSVVARVTSSAATPDQMLPEKFELSEPFPNPFNPSTKIRFTLPEPSTVGLLVHNTLGITVARLLEAERGRGVAEVEWCADNLPSGVYFIRLRAESLDGRRRFSAFKKIVLVK